MYSRKVRQGMRLRIISWETLEKLRREEDILIIDLREREEYDQTHAPGAVWADWERLEEEMPQYLKKRGRTPQWIVLYCDRGNTSLLIARDLARRGYPVMSINGGYHMREKARMALSDRMPGQSRQI